MSEREPSDWYLRSTWLRKLFIHTKIIINWLKELSLYYKTIVSLGNHDFLRKENNGYRYEYLKDFWEEINSIDNIYLSHFNTLYEDDNVFIYMPELDYRYYENYNKDEDLYYLLKKINTDKDIITNLDPHKIKIMMIHSPYLLQNEDVLKLISEFDIVLSGHMHNGLVLPVLDELIKNNKGITTPTGKLFKDNCRGYKNVYVNGKYVRFIMSGGITKLSKNSGFLSHFNGLYPACIENINIKTKKYTN